MSTNKEIIEKMRYERMVFDYGTTSRTDFRDMGPQHNIKTIYKEKPKHKKVNDTRVKDIHTMCHFQKKVPFNTFIEQKPIVRTNPNAIQKAFTKIDDADLEMVIKTRPRLIISPALSLDDVPKPQRSLLIEQCYTSDMSAHNKETTSEFRGLNVKAPLPGLPAPPRPVQTSLRKLTLPMVPYEWRMDSCAWDGRQVRSSRDSAKEFWLHQPIRKCQPCEQTARLKAMNK